MISSRITSTVHKAGTNSNLKTGQPESHEKAKEILAGFSGAFIDRIVETKGLDYIDTEKAKHHARQQAEEGLSNSGDF